MATADAEGGNLKGQIAEIGECPICTDKITNNRQLPCGHTFCLKCLEQYKRTTKARGKLLQCPVCRREFTIPKGGCSVLPKNIIVEKLIGINTSNMETNDAKLCDTCEKNDQGNASVHCIECDQSLCNECEKRHRKLKTTASHHVVPVSKTSQFKEFPQRNYCENHPEFILELMCNDCSIPICWKCRSVTHQTHRVAEVRELADGYCEQIQSDIEDISNRVSILGKVVTNIKDYENQYLGHLEKEKNKVSKTSKDLIRSIVANEEKLMRQLSATLQKNFNALQPQRLQIDKQLDQLKLHMASAEQLKQSGNDWEIFRRTEDIHNKTKELLLTSIVSVNSPDLTKLSETEIQNQLVGTNANPIEYSSSLAAEASNLTPVALMIRKWSTLPHQTHPVRPRKQEILDPPTVPKAVLGASLNSNQLNSTCEGKVTSAYLSKISPSFGEPDKVGQTIDILPNTGHVTGTRDTVYNNIPSSDIYENLSASQCSPSTSSSTKPFSRPILATNTPEVLKTSRLNIASEISSMPIADRLSVFGVTTFKEKLYVSVEQCSDIFVYNSVSYQFLGKLGVPGLKQASDLAFCCRSRCLYMIDWEADAIFRVETEGKRIMTKFSTNKDIGGISITGIGNIILAAHESNSLKEFESTGGLLNTIKITSDGNECFCPWHALKLTSGEFIVSQGSSGEKSLHRVCLLDPAGRILKSFGGFRGSGIDKLFGPYHLAVDGEQNIIIADCNNSRVLILNANFEYLREISDLRKPRRLCLDVTCNKLYVSQSDVSLYDQSPYAVLFHARKAAEMENV